jgi:hypothetical protein
MILPPNSIIMEVLKNCMMTPPAHTMQATMMVLFLPIMSLMKPVAKAEQKMPMVLAALRICWFVAEMTQFWPTW